MRRVAIVAALGVLSALYLYSAFAPGRRRNVSQPFKLGWIRRLLHGFLGVALLLCFLLLVYAGVMSAVDD